MLTLLVASGALLALGGGVAQASFGYVQSGSFPVGVASSVGVAVDRSSGSFAGDLYEAPYGEGVAQFAPPFSSSTTVSETFEDRVSGLPTPFSGVAVAASGQYVYALDRNAGQVDIFDPAGGSTTTPLNTFGSGTISPGDDARIWVDSAGDAFVPDNAGNVVYEFTPTSPNSNEYTGAHTVIGLGTLSDPTAVAVDSTGIVYVVDAGNARVAVFSPSGTFLGALPGLTNPSGIAVDPSTNDAFVIDQPGGVAQVDDFSPSTGTSPADFARGSVITTFGSGDFEEGPPATTGVAVDASSNVYVAAASSCCQFFSRGKIYSPSVPPTATTLPGASGISAGDATVCGSVNPQDPTDSRSTTWYFEYGTDLTYGSYSPAPPPGTGDLTGDQPIQVCTTLTGLQPNKTYHFQLIAVNPEGEAEGGDQTFITHTVRPSVAGQSSSDVTQTGATLHAQINPNNQPTTYQFQYGTGIDYSLGSVPASPGPVGEGYGDTPESAVLSALQPNTLYHYRVVAVNVTGTTEGVDHTFTTLPNGPSVTTGAASGVGQSAATLTGTIDPQGAETSYYFEYSGPGTFSIVSGTAGSGSSNTTVTAPVNGLTPGAAYQYRLIATNAGGTMFGSYQTFTTAPPPPSGPPSVATDGTSDLTPSSATLGGTVNPNGGATNYQFQYGASAAYGASLPEASAGSGAEPQGVAASLAGLAPGTAYHYRLVATNAAGASYGADQTFTTPAAPVSAFGPLPRNVIIPNTTLKPTPPKLTRAQQLAKALKACKKHSKRQRASCIKRARKKYAPPKKVGKRK